LVRAGHEFDFNETDAGIKGEQALRDSGLAPTLLRPSVIFGAEDSFLNLFAALQSVAPFVPLAGATSRFQPVWVHDVARAIATCLERPDTAGLTFECAGPETLTLADLVRLAGRLAGHPRPLIGLPDGLGRRRRRSFGLSQSTKATSTHSATCLSLTTLRTASRSRLTKPTGTVLTR
jgi:uncharacterized protein YbjT (DUF2867 family)